ncbi:peptidase [Acidovorax sp. HMWF029]|uniref:PepSY-associated TM helix domain-containing protein n=1 Tax=Acidovorax sp. HMWF029 TaxID=2056863 RepID=UPI000D3B0744|nr:PepSY-associated TM helix domain-containing protein [Acidovorax sp. HMWF029]PTT23763.1 peptidase [Acidovorax sp. HMWF029]
MQHAKRWLYLVHRWLGVLLCAFFAMWFVSGVVMMYVGYPKLTQAERLAHLPPLRSATLGTAPLLEPAEALTRAGMAGPLQDLRLAAASGGRPVYLVVPAAPTGDAAPRPRRPPAPAVIDATTGERLQRVDTTHAIASARAFAQEANPSIEYQGTIDEDAFTHSRALDVHRPLHRLHLGDSAGTVVYVSGTTGEVVRDAPLHERAWNYVGAWIHWLYPFRGNVFNDYWTDIVNWLSIAGIVLTVTGTVVGVLRWRFKGRYKTGSRTPYRGFMMRWHHVFGLVFALITFTWIFSGLMSMNPWKIFDSGAAPLRQQAMNGGPLVLPAQAATVQALLSAGSPNTRELRWVRSAGHTLVLAHSPVGAPAVLDATTAAPHTWGPEAVAKAATHLLPHAVVRIDTLTAYDLHYYDRAAHTMTGGAEKPLPALRVVFDDPQATWVHIDPHTGAVLGRTDSHRRTSRWLFAMLHSWDWLPLLERRPLWDIVLIVLSLGGAVMSLTGVVIGWRRLGHKLHAFGTGSAKPSRAADAVR